MIAQLMYNCTVSTLDFGTYHICIKASLNPMRTYPGGLGLGRSLYLQQDFVYASHKDSGESVHFTGLL